MKKLLIFCFFAFLSAGAWGGEVVFQFEDGLQDWKVVEGSLGEFRSGREFFHHLDHVKYNKEGNFFLSSLETGKGGPNDGYRGIAESPVWKNTGKEISMLVGGGNGPEEYIGLCVLELDDCGALAQNPKVVRFARGANDQKMVTVTWNVEDLIGKMVFLRMYDNSDGSWAHITLDNVLAQGDLLPEVTQTYRKNRVEVIPDLPEVREIVPTTPDANAKTNPDLVRQPILIVARKQYSRDHHNTATMFQCGEINGGSFREEGAALRVLNFAKLDADGKPEVTTIFETEKGVIRDPDVSFDGKKILFSYRKSQDDDYNIYEINADGTGLRQITSRPGITNIDPIYLPSGKILFSSTQEPKYCMCNRHIMCNLHTMNADGSGLDQIGHSTLFEGHSSVLADGRIVYDRWEYVDRNFGDAQGLWVTNPDGTSHLLFWGNNTESPGAILDAHEIPGSHQVVCTFSSCHDRPWGAIAILDRTKGVDSPNAVRKTLPSDAINIVGSGGYDAFSRLPVKYEDPCPLSAQTFLASRMQEGERMGLILFDLSDHETLIYEEPEYGVFDAIPLASRPVPREIEPKIDLTQKTGTFYVSDVYQSQEMDAVERGEVKYLRVVESPEKRFWSRSAWGVDGEQAPAMNYSDFSNKRILGTVPVEADGSANFEVPADTFVYFQLLDQDGKMVHSMRSGTIVRPGEQQGCIGCHENRLDAVPPRRTVQALLRPASKLQLPAWQPTPVEFSFMRDVQPVFTKHCVQCHDFDGPGAKTVVLAPDRNLIFNTAYAQLYFNFRHSKLLTVPGAGPTKTLPAKSWGSYQGALSKVIWQGHGDERDKKFSLSAEDRDRVTTWIDLNAPYYPYFATNYRENPFGRSPLTRAELLRLGELTGTYVLRGSSAEWGGGDKFNYWKIVFDRPEKSPCLVGMDPASQAYREAVSIIRTGAARLKERPRADMEGFRLLDEFDVRQEDRYQERLESLKGE